MSTFNTDNAIGTFLDRIAEADRLLVTLQAAVTDHLNADPEDVTWANVGDASRLVDLLRQACEGLELHCERDLEPIR
jgi:hypothetical protein